MGGKNQTARSARRRGIHRYRRRFERMENMTTDRRTTDRRISPAIGEFAITENARLRASNKELVEALKTAQVRIFMLEGASDEYQKAAATITKATS